MLLNNGSCKTIVHLAEQQSQSCKAQSLMSMDKCLRG